ncbi:MAG: family 16 glycoside hydrolase [Opitutus sp.]
MNILVAALRSNKQLWLMLVTMVALAECAVAAFDAKIPPQSPAAQSAAEARVDRPAHVYPRTWQERRKAWRLSREQDRGAIVWVGDSAVAGGEQDLAAQFPTLKIANRGIPGDSAQGVAERLVDDVLSLNPAAVVLQIGSNELQSGATPEAIAVDFKLILQSLESHSPSLPVIVCQVFPGSADGRPSAESVKALNALILDAVRQHPTITYVETWSMFADAQGHARSVDFPKQLNPSTATYEKWAAAVRPILSTLGILTEPVDEFQIEPGYVSLFNGRDLTGWGFRPTPQADIDAAKKRDAASARPPVRFYSDAIQNFDGVATTPEGRYVVRAGKLVVTTPPEYRKIQQLWTQREFTEDFVLKLEFRATPNADSGVYLRGPQLQVRDYTVAGPYLQLKNYRPQDWNELEVTVRGSIAVCVCNGEVLEAAFKVPSSGPIGLEGDRGQMEYRRIRLKVAP